MQPSCDRQLSWVILSCSARGLGSRATIVTSYGTAESFVDDQKWRLILPLLIYYRERNVLLHVINVQHRSHSFTTLLKAAVLRSTLARFEAANLRSSGEHVTITPRHTAVSIYNDVKSQMVIANRAALTINPCGTELNMEIMTLEQNKH